LNELEDKTELVGSWIVTDGQIADDAISRIIEDLIKNQLQKLAVASDGWETLYIDPRDQRLWELTFPKSEMHGGGPKALRLLTPIAAKQKYDLP
jgi:Immunity protein 27